MNSKRKVVSIEGNTGCGKSTFLKFFSDYPHAEISPEPVSTWCNFHGHNFLQKRFEDPSRWTFAFQSLVQLTRLEILKTNTQKSHHIIERSLQSNRYCFIETARKLGSLGEEEYVLLKHWYEMLEKTSNINLDLIVYLRTTPEVSLRRIRKRGRPEERGISLEFLQSIHDCYERWLMAESSLTCPVIIVDANEDMETLCRTLEQRAAEIMAL